ncbi:MULTISPECIES: Bro-N domain-containing protein [unclassified Pseudomonas]|uniref:BRO-N domain-containing protein n=1 Tax=unclassified Pseudomonas TaxID=196821 RepID=UPI00128DBD86|nr:MULTISPECIES: Bro-N domain-containing protein [unclassified Pseudomonas]MPQ68320.1 hypothetical protein [Pseudomonas sp. MWU12-2323]
MVKNTTAASSVIPFRFESREVRTLLIDDQPWFVGSDVSAALAYTEASRMTRNLDEDEKGLHIVVTPGGEQEMLVINESGLYSAILRSRKAEAKRFKKWVTAEVLPAIHKYGHYHDGLGRMGTLIGQTIGTDGFHMLGSIIKGKVAELPMPARRRAMSKIWSQTHVAFGVRSAEDIPAEQLDAARNFIAAYVLREGDYLPKEPVGVLALDDGQALAAWNLMHSAAWTVHHWEEGIGPAMKLVHSRFYGNANTHITNLRQSVERLKPVRETIESVCSVGRPSDFFALMPEECQNLGGLRF